MAQSAQLRLVAVLRGSEPARLPGPEFPSQLASLIVQTIQTLQQQNALAAYRQIAAFQIEELLNHPGCTAWRRWNNCAGS